ncbi:MAG: pilus assembly protein N-terminal domain-containing protein [Armatimonadetes bacterium]|nr:pilus assembly protein N-terminal domain-containing protein [Armatimonadota bacterium]
MIHLLPRGGLRQWLVPALLSGSLAPSWAVVTTHIVQRGDRLTELARRYKTTVRAIAARNGLAEPDRIRPGVKLIILVGEGSPATGAPKRQGAAVPGRLEPLPPLGRPLLLPPSPKEREPEAVSGPEDIRVEVLALEPATASRERATGVVARRSLQVGESLILDFNGITRVAVGNPAVADVAVLSTRQLLVNGKSAGKTELFVWDARGRSTYHLVVKTAVDMADVARRIEKDLDNPDIRVRAVGETILLEGKVSSQLEMQKAEAVASAHTKTVKSLLEVQAPPPPARPPLAEEEAPKLARAIGIESIRVRALNDTAIGVEGKVSADEADRVQKIIGVWGKEVQILNLLQTAPAARRQIMVKVRVVDINKSKLKNLGVDWGRVVEDDNGRVTVQDQPFLFGQPRVGPFDILSGGPIRRFDPIGARLQAMIQDNQARILSEPNLVVMDGEKGDFLVGGSIPIPVLQSSGAGGGTGAITVQYQEYGVKLNIEPKTEADGLIRLKVVPEVSSLDYANAVRINSFSVPALRTRKASTVVTMADGQTLVIGGLLQNDISRVVKRIPLLSKIPILGELFQSKSFTKGESELVILVSPEILKTEGR